MRAIGKIRMNAGGGGPFRAAAIAFWAAALTMAPTLGHAQPTPESVWNFFGDGVGDPYSSVFLNRMFGPLFASASNSGTDAIFGRIIPYFNVVVLLVGGMLFFYNVTVGLLQSAHEGQVLGARWSSLWGPLRVVFAVGMLVPVNNGYNLAQTGVAHVVRGGTKMASAVWVAAAKAVISDDIPLAASVTNFDTDVMTSMYEQAACMSALQAQIVIANPEARVDYLISDGRGDDGNRHHYESAIHDGSRWLDHGVCGGWSTPRTPRYLDNVIEGMKETAVADGSITEAKARQLMNAFRDGHRDIMLGVAGDMRAVTDSRYVRMMSSDIAPPSIAGEIAAAHAAATGRLAALIGGIRTLATSDAAGVSRSRDALLTRITGSEACFSADGSHNASSNRAASVACYGEGWMGAGSWYILMAKINNELSSLANARASTSGPSYFTLTVWPRGIFGRTGDGRSGWFRLPLWNDTGDSPSVRQSTEAMWKYRALFRTSAVELAALGYEIPTAILNEGNHSSGSDASRFWRLIVPEELMLKGTRVLMNTFDPGAGGGDPMVDLISLGHWLISAGAGVLFAAVAGGAVTGGGAAVALLPVYSLLLGGGVSLSFILPIMPFLYWILAVLGYFLLITEAVVAVNLWALSHLRMDGEGISGEAGHLGWLMLLSLFMTPTLMVFGFIVGMILFRVVSDLISAGLFHAVSAILGTNPVVILFGTVGYVILMVTSHGLLLERSFSLISEFPNRVMRWMGSSVEIGGGESRAHVAAGVAAVGVNSLGSGFARNIGGLGDNGKFIKGKGMAGRLRQYVEWKKEGYGSVAKDTRFES